MSIFGTLHIGKQAALVHQQALQVTSRNIANANTEGYTRQRAILEPEASVSQLRGFSSGGGVTLDQVQRVVDERTEAQILQERQGLGWQRELHAGLLRAEGALDELADAGLAQGLSRFFAALGDVANQPGDTAARESAVRSLDALTGQIRGASRKLAEIQFDSNQQVGTSVSQINELVRNIAELNEEIVRHEFASDSGFSELRDQRGVLLQELSDQLDFNSFEREDGTVVIVLGDGLSLVDGSAFAQLEASTEQPVALGDPTFTNVFHVANGSRSGPVTQHIRGGVLGGAIALRDGRIPFYRQQLDSFAFSFASAVNTVHLAGRGLEDATARNLLIDPSQAGPNPPGATFAAVLGAADRISVNPLIAANARHLAAGQPAAGAAQPGDNTNALALAALREQPVTFFPVGDPILGPASGTTQTLPSFFSTVSGQLGAELRSSTRATEQLELVLQELQDRRAEISGVSIDEEVTNLLRYQRGFEAAVRVITTADRMLEALLAI
jgi:flagellar hook-associated protein 1